MARAEQLGTRADGAASPRARTEIPPAERGLALGLFSADPSFHYDGLIREVRQTGASHIALTWVWWQQDVRATEIVPVPGWSATRAQVLRAIRVAKAEGLHVTLFPIVRLKESARGEWRGKIQPASEAQWWSSYEAYLLEAASLAREARADRLSIGSELLSRERMRERWLALIDKIRIKAPNIELMYSANWDHYDVVSFWDAVDVIGLTAYWELTKDLEATVENLRVGWAGFKAPLEHWCAAIGRPVVITEIGYPSLDGGAAWPWDETRKSRVDLEEQRRAYEAFVAEWSGQKFLAGVYFWNWFGFGGPEDTNYTPRGKPAEKVIRRWYGRARVR